MIGKLIGKGIAEIVKAPFEALEHLVVEATEPCTCRKHAIDPNCPRHRGGW